MAGFQVIMYGRIEVITEDNIAWAVRNFGPLKTRRLSVRQRNAIARRFECEMSQLRAAGQMGNVLLPQELYGFVKKKIETGEFSSPTDVLTAAMPFLRAQRGKSLRAELFGPYRFVLFG